MARRNSILVSRSLYQIGVITMIAAVAWVAIGIYLATGKDFKLDVDKSVLEPLSPTLDQEVIKSLTGRLKIETDTALIPVATESALTEDANISVDGTR